MFTHRTSIGTEDKEQRDMDYKNAAARLAHKIGWASHVVAVFVISHDLFNNSWENIATAASLWIAMNLCSFFLESWSDGLPDP
jgi:hypothetical protein